MATDNDEEREAVQPGVNSTENTPVAPNPAQGDEVSTPADPAPTVTPGEGDPE